MAKSLNKILKKTTGTFIARMDADDISNPNRINYQLNLLKNKKVDFLSSGIEYFGENNNKKNTIKFHRPSLNSYETKTRLLFYNPINHPTVFFKKSIIKNIIFDPKHESFEDWSCWIKLIDTNIKMLCSPTVLVKYRKHLKNNSLKNSNKKDKEITMIIK